MKSKVGREIISWILVIAIAVGLAFFINRFVILKVVIPSGSMERTIMTGDKVLTYRQAYLFSDPKRGDIIVFPFPDDEKVYFIKRIIGLPGETIEGKNGYVYINGKKLVEKYVTELLGDEFGPYKIPKDSYFMMGDSRGVSDDARYWNHKYVKRSKIIGKAIFKYKHLDFVWLAKKIKYK